MQYFEWKELQRNRKRKLSFRDLPSGLLHCKYFKIPLGRKKVAFFQPFYWKTQSQSFYLFFPMKF